MDTLAAVILTFAAFVLPPCASEDSTQCYWDASAQGNGQGHSFIDIGGSTYYLP